MHNGCHFFLGNLLNQHRVKAGRRLNRALLAIFTASMNPCLNEKNKRRAFVYLQFPVSGLLFIFFFLISPLSHGAGLPVTSSREEAIRYIEEIKNLERSNHWPNIKPSLFLQNLKLNVTDPLSIYPGNSTNFCGYGALSYLFLQDDPLGYAKLLVELYQDGKAVFHQVKLEPSEAVKRAAGQLRFKGTLDIRPAEQMLFMTLAGHYKGYLNFFNRRYNPGDENTFWASCNLAKFNRMVRQLLLYKVKSRGADMARPQIDDLPGYIRKRLETGIVVLYINNRIVHRKNHVTIKLSVPTHFVIAEKIEIEDDKITLVYWDYGRKTLLQMSPAFFKRIVFGVTHCTKKENNAD